MLLSTLGVGALEEEAPWSVIEGKCRKLRGVVGREPSTLSLRVRRIEELISPDDSNVLST